MPTHSGAATLSASGALRATSRRVVLGVWSTLVVATPPTATYGAAGATVDGKFYITGGATAPYGVEAYDPVLNTWSVKNSMSGGRYFHAAVSLGGYLYVVGGYGFDLFAQASTLFRYDPTANTWTTLTPIPAALSSSVAAAADPTNNKIYAFPLGTTTTMYIYNVGTDTWSTGTQPAFNKHWATMHTNGKVYLCKIDAPMTMYEYNPATTTFTAKAGAPVYRTDFSQYTYGGYIWIVGGQQNPKSLALFYDPVANTYGYGDELVTGRFWAAADVLDGRPIIAGGFDGAVPLSSAETFGTPVLETSAGFDLNLGLYPYKTASAVLDLPMPLGIDGRVNTQRLTAGFIRTGHRYPPIYPSSELFPGSDVFPGGS